MKAAAFAFILLSCGVAAGVTYQRISDHYALTSPEPCRENTIVHANGEVTHFPGIEARGVQICGSMIYEGGTR